MQQITAKLTSAQQVKGKLIVTLQTEQGTLQGMVSNRNVLSKVCVGESIKATINGFTIVSIG